MAANNDYVYFGTAYDAVYQFDYNVSTTLSVTGDWKATAADKYGNNVWACGDGLVYKTSNGGSSWSSILPASSSTSSYQWSAVSACQLGKYVLVGAVSQGVWFSSNYGSSWTKSLTWTVTINHVWCNPSGQYAVVSSACKLLPPYDSVAFLL